MKKLVFLLLFLLTFPSMARDIPITAWAAWGPGWGRAGLGVIRNNSEQDLWPQPGDIEIDMGVGGRGMVAWRAVYADIDGTVKFLDANQFPRIKQSRQTWAGSTEYLHTYVKLPGSKATNIPIEFVANPNPATVWINGKEVINGERVRFNAGYNRVLVKSPGPASIQGNDPNGPWNFRMILRNVPSYATFRLSPPNRLVQLADGMPYRYQSRIQREDGETPIYIDGEAVTLNYTLRVGLGVGNGYQVPEKRNRSFGGELWAYSIDPSFADEYGAHAFNIPGVIWDLFVADRVVIRITNDQGKVIYDRKLSLDYFQGREGELESALQLQLGQLPLGHYVIRSRFINEYGHTLLWDYDHSFAVIWGPVDRTNDVAPRSLTAVGHWIMGTSNWTPSGWRFPERLRWLKKVGFTRQQKFWEGWDHWGVRQNGDGNITLIDAPRVEHMLSIADDLDIDVIGELIEGFYRRGLQAIEIPGQWNPLPAAGSPEWENMYFQYGFQMASKYGDRFDYWGGLNEVDLHVADDFGADLVTRAQRQIVAGMRAANPGIEYISSSIVRSGRANRLFNLGWLDEPDIVDVHSHPFKAPRPTDNTLTPYSNGEGTRLLASAGYDGPVVYGEMSAPSAHSPRGALGQAEAIPKQLAWAVNHRDDDERPIKWISYLVPYNGPDYRWPWGFCNYAGDPLPAVNAVNVASHLLDGRNVLPSLSLPEKVHHIIVDSSGPEDYMVIWSEIEQRIRLPHCEKYTGGGYDLFGRSFGSRGENGRGRTLIIRTIDECLIDVGPTPVYVAGYFR